MATILERQQQLQLVITDALRDYDPSVNGDLTTEDTSHSLVHYMTMNELLTELTNISPVEFHLETMPTFRVVGKFDFADIAIVNGVATNCWDANSPTDELWVLFELRDIAIDQPEIILELNQQYAGIQIYVDAKWHVVARAKIIFRGGICRANLHWQLAHAFQDAERAHHQLMFFQD